MFDASIALARAGLNFVRCVVKYERIWGYRDKGVGGEGKSENGKNDGGSVSWFVRGLGVGRHRHSLHRCLGGWMMTGPPDHGGAIGRRSEVEVNAGNGRVESERSERGSHRLCNFKKGGTA